MEPTKHDAHVPGGPSPRAAGTTSSRRRGQVRAIARAAGRSCSRNGCDTPAAATLVFSYQERIARVVELLDVGEPQAYDLCPVHADRTRPPVGWELSDTRPPRSDSPRRLDDEETVAVLAAALRGEAPRTRVSVVEGGRESDDDATTDPEATAAVDPDPDVDPDVDEDPLRAALEELQRVATPDDDPTVVSAEATPLRRDAGPTVLGLQESDASEPEPWTSAAIDDGDMTLW